MDGGERGESVAGEINVGVEVQVHKSIWEYELLLKN